MLGGHNGKDLSLSVCDKHLQDHEFTECQATVELLHLCIFYKRPIAHALLNLKSHKLSIACRKHIYFPLFAMYMVYAKKVQKCFYFIIIYFLIEPG